MQLLSLYRHLAVANNTLVCVELHQRAALRRPVDIGETHVRYLERRRIDFIYVHVMELYHIRGVTSTMEMSGVYPFFESRPNGG